MPELTSIIASRSVIYDVGLCRGRYQRRKIQDVKDVEEVCADGEFGSFSGQRELLAERHVDGAVAGTGKDIAAAAAWTTRCDVEVWAGCRRNVSADRVAGGKDPVNPLLLARVSDNAAEISKRLVGTIAIPVPVVVLVTSADQGRVGEATVFAHKPGDGPPTESRTEEVMASAKYRYLPERISDKVLSYVEVGIATIEQLIAGIGLLEANLERRGVDGMTPCVIGAEFDAMARFVIGAKNTGVVAGINIR